MHSEVMRSEVMGLLIVTTDFGVIPTGFGVIPTGLIGDIPD